MRVPWVPIVIAALAMVATLPGRTHGLGLIKTVALPSGRQLSVGVNNNLKGSDQLQWQVTVQNQGDFPESNITVTATFSYQGFVWTASVHCRGS